jgi:hypothetical protein
MRAVTGALPAYFCSAVVDVYRARGSPKATRRREAKTGPAPGRAWKSGTSGWGSSSSSWSAAALGSSLARLGVKASRSRASRSGLPGKRTRKSYWRKAETRGPWSSSRQIAIGQPLHRVRSVVPHASMASGVCSSCKHSRWAVPAAWRPPSCFASAQSIPIKAVNASCDVCVMRHLPECVRVARGTCTLTFCAGMIGSR